MKKVSSKTYLVETIDDAPGQEFTGKKTRYFSNPMIQTFE